MGEIYLSNLSGQFDYKQILDKYEQLKLQRVNLIQSKEIKVQQAKSAFKTYANMLKDFQDKFEAIKDGSFLDRKSIEIDNKDIADVTITDQSAAESMELSFTVKQLARNDVWLSQSGKASKDDSVASEDGTLTITINNEDIDIDYTSSDSLEQIANKIDQASEKINASIFFDGQNYRLLVSSRDTGTNSTLSFSDSGDLLDALDLGSTDSHVQAAQNAKIDIYGTEVESQTDRFSDVISGVEIEIKKVSSEPVRVKIAQDKEQITKMVEEFFNAYNSLVDYAKEKTGKGGELSGDFTLHSIRSSIFNTFTPFMEKGLITVNHENGHITLDRAKFTTLLASDEQELKDTIKETQKRLEPYLDAVFDPYGVIRQKEKSYDRKIEQYEDSKESTIKMLTLEMERLKKQFIHLDSMMAQMNDVKMRVAALIPKEQQ